MRDYYFETQIDIGSSGVEDYSLKEIGSLVGLSGRIWTSWSFTTAGPWETRSSAA